MNARPCLPSAVLAACVACLAFPQSGRSQSFSFSIGSYPGYHHHHCWHDPYWWGPRYDYVYVAPPPPIVRREIRYVQPVEQVIETRVQTPQAVAAPQPAPVQAPRVASQSPLKVWNSGGQKLPVAFVVDGQEVTLHEGQSHTFYGSGARLVEFDRGGDFGITRRSLTGSEYEFVITAAGWDLVRRDDTGPVGPRAASAAPRNVLPR